MNSKEPRIRKASSEDCTLINQMATIVFPYTYREILTPGQIEFMMEWMYSPENLKKQMTEEEQTYFIGYLNEKPFGYISIQPEGEDAFHLQKIYVLPDFQKLGLGKYLFEQAKEHIKEIHPTPCMLYLNVNRHNKAKQFYEQLGMEVKESVDVHIGEGFYMNDYIMQLVL